MACSVKEVLCVFFYKICNPKRSDYEVEESSEFWRLTEIRQNEEAERRRLKKISQVEALRLKALLVKAKHERFEAEFKRLRTISENNNENEDFCLPSDILVIILSRLAFKDNIRSSAVCKTWCEIAASVRVRDGPCWLMYLDQRDNGVFYGFFDPIEKKMTKAMNLPCPSKSVRILYYNDGWLLMREFRVPQVNIYFFNPFTLERINLPGFDIPAMNFAFSCAPTKKGCLVSCIINFLRGGEVTISTWRPGETTWAKEDFRNVFRSDLPHARNILYLDGLFYMASEFGLGVFDPSAHTWSVLPVQPLVTDCLETYPIRWMAEYKGQILLVDASSMEPMVFSLNRLESVWERTETLDGSSIFVSNGSCVMASGLTGSMSNVLYFWSGDFFRRRPSKHERPFPIISDLPYKYSLYSCSLCEDPEGYYFERSGNQVGGVWIEPPHNISISDFSIIEKD